MRLILNKILIFVICLISYSGTALATQNWTWFTSNDYETRYIDLDSIEYTHNYSGNGLNSVTYWEKINYSYEGALRQLKNEEIEYKASPSELSHSIWKVKLNLKDKTVDVLTKVFYRKDGTVIHSGDADYNLKLYVPTRYVWERDYYYMLSYITKNDDYDYYQNNEKRFLVVDARRKDDGTTRFIYIDKLSVKDFGKNIECVTATYTFSGDTCLTHYVTKGTYDISAKKKRTGYVNYKKGDEWIFEDRYSDKESYLIPGTVGMHGLEVLEKFCKENYAFVHRYDNGIVKK